jgi:hypothetical protein
VQRKQKPTEVVQKRPAAKEQTVQPGPLLSEKEQRVLQKKKEKSKKSKA